MTWDGKEQRANHWHLRKEIPIGLIIAVSLQWFGVIAVGSWFVASTTARINTVEEWVAKNDAITERLVVLETGQRFILADLQEIKAKLK